MKNKIVTEKISRAFDRSVPDVLDTILTNCAAQKGEVIMFSEKKTGHKMKWVAGLVAALLVISFVFTGIFYVRQNVTVAATVSLDVNPSIEILVNRQERILSVQALNDEARIVLGEMNFKGSNLDVAVNAIIGSLLRNGYLNELTNSILVSVRNDDPQRGLKIQERLTKEINDLLQTKTFSGAVLSQTIAKGGDLQKLAQTYGITMGKANLINKIIEQDPAYSFADLVSLTINELNLLRSNRQINLDKVESMGQASEKAFIGSGAALKIALNQAGIEPAAVITSEIELDYEDGVMVYEVEFKTKDNAYEYDIDARTGEIVKFKKEKKADSEQTGSSSEATTKAQEYIGEVKARAKALEHAGKAENQVTGLKVELDKEDGIMVYEVEFKADGYKYEYEINALTGKVVKFEKEQDKKATTTGTTRATTKAQEYIGEAKARTIALEHAGKAENQVTRLKVELEKEDGIMVYEVEFKADGYEYEYEINALTGKVVKFEKEQDKKATTTGTTRATTTASQYIGETKATAYALAHAGKAENQVSGLRIKLDREDGIMVYEVEFKAGGYKYEYEINASNGKIIEAEQELDKKITSQPAEADKIGEDKALEIALKHAGLKAANVTKVKVKLEKEHGIWVYEVEFKAGGYEYEYEIDAVSGQIIEAEQELD